MEVAAAAKEVPKVQPLALHKRDKTFDRPVVTIQKQLCCRCQLRCSVPGQANMRAKVSEPQRNTSEEQRKANGPAIGAMDQH